MPSFINDQPHAVRIAKPNAIGQETLVRVLPGQVVDADGEFADNLTNAGLPQADEGARGRWQASLGADAPSDVMGTGIAARAALGPARVAIRQALVVAPLRRVVGDDMAPYGPPSGVVTTKGAVVGDGTDFEARRAYADNEALAGQRIPGAGEVNPNMPAAGIPSEGEVHNSQVTNAELSEHAASSFVEGDVAATNTGAAQGGGGLEYEARQRADLLELAEEKGVTVEGTGSGGYVTKRDLVTALRAADAGGEPPAPEEQATTATSAPDEETGVQEQAEFEEGLGGLATLPEDSQAVPEELAAQDGPNEADETLAASHPTTSEEAPES